MCFMARESTLVEDLKKFRETYSGTNEVYGWKLLKKSTSGKLTSIHYPMEWERGEYVSAKPSKKIPPFTFLPDGDLLIEVRGGIHIFREKDKALLEKECENRFYFEHEDLVIAEVSFKKRDLIAVSEEVFVVSSAKVTWVVGEVPV